MNSQMFFTLPDIVVRRRTVQTSRATVSRCISGQWERRIYAHLVFTFGQSGTASKRTGNSGHTVADCMFGRRQGLHTANCLASFFQTCPALCSLLPSVFPASSRRVPRPCTMKRSSAFVDVVNLRAASVRMWVILPGDKSQSANRVRILHFYVRARVLGSSVNHHLHVSPCSTTPATTSNFSTDRSISLPFRAHPLPHNLTTLAKR